MKKYQLFNGNNIDKLRELEDNSIDSIVTDPPYGLSAAKNSGKRSKGGFMGKQWDYDVPSVEVWAECLRVLKHGGHLLAFAGTRTQHRMAVRIEDAGFEIRDMIAWVYGSGFPKSLDVSKAIDRAAGAEREVVGIMPSSRAKASESGFMMAQKLATAPSTEAAKQWEGWGTALKPAMEPITVARKPLIGTVAENVLQYGTGGLNIDNSRVEFVSDADRKESTAKNQHADFGTAPITNNIVYGDYSMMKPKNYNPPGRWPANFIHDGSDEVVGLFPMTGKGNGGEPYNYAGKEYNNKDSSMFNGDKPQAPSNFNDNGSAARFFYCPKVSKSERNAGCDNKHPTVKPTDLMRYLCKLITPPGGIVLDPFMGSGSTGCAALLDGFKFIGMELDDEYFKIAEARITHINPSDFW
jgi:DNA modification methylase